MGELVFFYAGGDVYHLAPNSVKGFLINVFSNGSSDQAINYTRRLIEYTGAEVVMLDSGGFTLLNAEKKGWAIGCDEQKEVIQEDKANQTKKINLTPHHVVRAALALQPHIMVALDFPLDTIRDPKDQEFEFKRKLLVNVNWARETADLRMKHCPEIKLFIPVQCYNLEHLRTFIKLIGDIQYDGFCMPIRNLTLEEILVFLMRFWEMGIKRVHLLGTGSFLNLAIGAYMAEHFFDWVSLDSTVWRINAQYAKYLNPHDLSGVSLSSKVMVYDEIDMDCSCPYCEGQTFVSIKNLPLQDKTMVLLGHNKWVIDKAAVDLKEAASSLANLSRLLRKRCKDLREANKLIESLAVIESFKGDPLEKWQHLLSMN